MLRGRVLELYMEYLDAIEEEYGRFDMPPEFWHEVLRRSVISQHAYNEKRASFIPYKPLKLYEHGKWEIPYTDEWVRYTVLNYLRKYDEYYDKNGNRVHFIRR